MTLAVLNAFTAPATVRFARHEQGQITRKERGRYAEGVVNKMRDAWAAALEDQL